MGWGSEILSGTNLSTLRVPLSAWKWTPPWRHETQNRWIPRENPQKTSGEYRPREITWVTVQDGTEYFGLAGTKVPATPPEPRNWPSLLGGALLKLCCVSMASNSCVGQQGTVSARQSGCEGHWNPKGQLDYASGFPVDFRGNRNLPEMDTFLGTRFPSWSKIT